jgi:lincosamide nucleotidyltransferase B/F
METDQLLKRLQDIAHSLKQNQHALALIGLGSVGMELERLDAYSDLDFFVIVEAGFKQAYLDDLSWLSQVCPIVYCFLNTKDGYKLLFADGIFCELAVFELSELPEIPFTRGRIIWKQPHIPESINQSAVVPSEQRNNDMDWLLGEALTNLYVGLGRDKRGEKLSAMRFIQGFAVDRILELAAFIEPAQEAAKDTFAAERRFEQRYPRTALQVGTFLQGYDRNCESALSILAFLEKHFPVNEAMAAAIRELGADKKHAYDGPP